MVDPHHPHQVCNDQHSEAGTLCIGSKTKSANAFDLGHTVLKLTFYNLHTYDLTYITSYRHFLSNWKNNSISAYFLLEDIILDPEKTYSDFQGCEFDYSSNTYRQDHQ